MSFQKRTLLLMFSALSISACASHGPDRHKGPRMEMDPAKMEARREEMQTRFLAKWDYDEDGLVTCDDIALKRSRLFRQLDSDNDGFLTSGEYRYAKFEDKTFLFYDFLTTNKNGDGGVDVDEFVAVPHSAFQRMDADSDCIVSPHEMMAAMHETKMGDPDRDRRGGKEGRGGRKGRGRSGEGGGRGEPF